MPGEGRDRNGLTGALLRVFSRGSRLAELIVFPTACKLCGRLLETPGERILCGACLAGIVPCRAPYCLRCGRFFDGEGKPHVCGSCLRIPPPFSRHRSAARYDGTLKEALLLLKYRGFRPLAAPLAELLQAALEGEDAPWRGADVLVPVPLHRRRRRERGFNQAAVLAAELSRRTGLPAEAAALKKTVNARPQTTLRSDERRVNIRGAYRAAKPGAIKGRTIVLLDDVYTTGSTMGECARVLLRAGAREIRGISVAQA